MHIEVISGVYLRHCRHRRRLGKPLDVNVNTTLRTLAQHTRLMLLTRLFTDSKGVETFREFIHSKHANRVSARRIFLFELPKCGLSFTIFIILMMFLFWNRNFQLLSPIITFTEELNILKFRIIRRTKCQPVDC